VKRDRELDEKCAQLARQNDPLRFGDRFGHVPSSIGKALAPRQTGAYIYKNRDQSPGTWSVAAEPCSLSVKVVSQTEIRVLPSRTRVPFRSVRSNTHRPIHLGAIQPITCATSRSNRVPARPTCGSRRQS
jgi:hypothetical protein